jgi:BirA family biotin operon repressor/biotin-[acetyl-CoA-carboxylase] ligase
MIGSLILTYKHGLAVARGLHPSYNAIMFTVENLRAKLPVGGLGEPLYFFSTIGSTSQYARELAEQGAPHGTLVVADEQTAGRGRGENRWSTPAESGIAFSLVLRPRRVPPEQLGGLNAVGALAVVKAIRGLGGEAEIKWPNDVLIHGRKVSGILTEATWQGNDLEGVVIGVGVNVRPESVPDPATLAFPATCLETALGAEVDRCQLLLAILGDLGETLGKLGSPALVQAWHTHLAFRGEKVRVDGPAGSLEGVLVGLTPRGFVELETAEDGPTEIGAEGASLRPIDS